MKLLAANATLAVCVLVCLLAAGAQAGTSSSSSAGEPRQDARPPRRQLLATADSLLATSDSTAPDPAAGEAGSAAVTSAPPPPKAAPPPPRPPPPRPPAAPTAPAPGPYTYLGCFNDPDLRDSLGHGERRMRARIGIVSTATLTVTQCANRARMFGYTLFAITPFLDKMRENAYECWAAGDYGNENADLASAQQFGSSATACTRTCVTAGDNTATACGGNWAISLYQLNGVTAPQLLGGSFATLTTLPISAAHTMQVTGREDFLFVDFYNNQAPSPAYDYTYQAGYYRRDSNTFDKAPPLNRELKSIACGITMRQSDGEIIGFSGHAWTWWNNVVWDENYRGLWTTYKYQNVVEQLKPMTWGRWYPGAYLNPEGRVVVTGGEDKGGAARGSEIYDSATMWLVGQTPGVDNPSGVLPLNKPLLDYSWVASYYPVVQCLPDGSLIYAQNIVVQTLNPVTGLAIAQSDWFPSMATMYPFEVPIVFGQQPRWYGRGYDWLLDILVFGGKWKWGDNVNKPCLDYSARGLFVINKNSVHWFSPWTVEQMPGPRCLSDAVLLPNGMITVLNGGELFAPGLGVGPNGENNYPINEAWIYDPWSDAGQRFKRTGAYTRQARAYHSTGLLTGRGDILITGGTINNYFRSYNRGGMERTPSGTANYVVEVFRPHYITTLGPRPAWLSAPAAMRYGSTITVQFFANSVTMDKIVLAENGHSTHSLMLGQRHVVLATSVVSTTGTGATAVTTWSITAPANTFLASPGFYQMYLVGKNGVYSASKWIQLRGDWNAVPPALRTDASRVVPEATSSFDTAPSPFGCTNPAQCLASVSIDPNAWASTGSGLRLRAQGANDNTPRTMFILSNAFAMNAGDRLHIHTWARMTEGGPVFATMTMDLVDDTGALVATGKTPNRAPQLSATIGASWEYYPLGGIVTLNAGLRRVRLSFAGCRFNTGVDIDDLVTTVIAAGARALPFSTSSAPGAGAAAAAGFDGPETWMGNYNSTPAGRPDLPLRNEMPDLAEVWPRVGPHGVHGTQLHARD